MIATHRHLHLVPNVPDNAPLIAAFERPDIVDLAGLRAIVGPELDGSVGVDFDGALFATMSPAETRQLAAALVRAADATEALTATA